MSISSSLAWQALSRHRVSLRGKTASCIDANDVARLKNFNLAFNGLRLNYALQNLTAETVPLLLALAQQQNVEGWRTKMFAGEKINTTENRAVLHTALRRTNDAPLLVNGVDVMLEIRDTQKRIAAFVDAVRSGQWKGATGKPIKTIVNIGIGGSDLGPRLVVQALQPFVSVVQTHFVANVDAFDIEGILKKIDAEQTLFVVVSKTFTTQETLLNATTARRWLVEKLGEAAVAKHFAAVSVNAKEIEKFGIPAANMFPMWDWVGGRYSLWSAVGICIALAIGNDNFRDLLAGAAAMDKHFVETPLAKNMPVLLALMAIWNRNFMESSSLAILSYSERLRDFPRFLQQLEMESNGKSVTRDGRPVDYATSPVLFGECGTVGQHSFHQCLHQGTDAIATDFIGVAHDDFAKPEHHRALLSNMVAQMGALAFGQPNAPKPQDIYPGGRSANLVMLDKLDPFHLGMLLALYEHKTFVQGIIWEINSFDQPGVELGKRMSKELESASGSNALTRELFESIVAKKA